MHLSVLRLGETVPKNVSVQEEKNHTRLEEAATLKQAETVDNGQMQEYRWSHLHAVQKRHIVPQDTMRQLIKLLVFLKVRSSASDAGITASNVLMC